MRIPTGAGAVLAMMSGLIIWASCFVVLYVGLSLGCTYGIPRFERLGLPGINWMLVVLWLAHIGVLAALALAAVRRWRRIPRNEAPRRFALRTTLALQLVGLVGCIWIGFPILMIPTCA